MRPGFKLYVWLWDDFSSHSCVSFFIFFSFKKRSLLSSNCRFLTLPIKRTIQRSRWQRTTKVQTWQLWHESIKKKSRLFSVAFWWLFQTSRSPTLFLNILTALIFSTSKVWDSRKLIRICRTALERCTEIFFGSSSIRNMTWIMLLYYDFVQLTTHTPFFSWWFHFHFDKSNKQSHGADWWRKKKKSKSDISEMNIKKESITKEHNPRDFFNIVKCSLQIPSSNDPYIYPARQRSPHWSQSGVEWCYSNNSKFKSVFEHSDLRVIKGLK